MELVDFMLNRKSVSIPTEATFYVIPILMPITSDSILDSKLISQFENNFNLMWYVKNALF